MAHGHIREYMLLSYSPLTYSPVATQHYSIWKWNRGVRPLLGGGGLVRLSNVHHLSFVGLSGTNLDSCGSSPARTNKTNCGGNVKSCQSFRRSFSEFCVCLYLFNGCAGGLCKARHVAGVGVSLCMRSKVAHLFLLSAHFVSTPV